MFKSKCVRIKRDSESGPILEPLAVALHDLIGLETTANVDILDAKISYISSITEQLVHFSNQSSSLYQNLLSSQKAISKSIVILTSQLIEINEAILHSKFEETKTAENLAFTNQLFHIMGAARAGVNRLIATLLSEIQLIEDLILSVTRGKLSRLIISPSKLNTFLYEIKQKLKLSSSKLTPWPESISDFFSIAQVQVMTLRDNVILLEIEVPLRKKAEKFKLAKYRSFPVSSPNYKTLIRLNLPDYIIHDSNMYSELTQSELDKACKFLDNRGICSLPKPMQAFTKELPQDRCLFALVNKNFTAENYVDCNAHITPYIQPTFERIKQNVFYYNFNTTKTAVVDCYHNTDPVIHDILPGSGRIELLPNCETIIDRVYKFYGINNYNDSERHVMTIGNVTRMLKIDRFILWDKIQMNIFEPLVKQWNPDSYQRLAQLHIIANKAQKEGILKLKQLKNYVSKFSLLPTYVTTVPFAFNLMTTFVIMIQMAAFGLIICDQRTLNSRMNNLYNSYSGHSLKPVMNKNGYQRISST